MEDYVRNGIMQLPLRFFINVSIRIFLIIDFKCPLNWKIKNRKLFIETFKKLTFLFSIAMIVIGDQYNSESCLIEGTDILGQSDLGNQGWHIKGLVWAEGIKCKVFCLNGPLNSLPNQKKDSKVFHPALLTQPTPVVWTNRWQIWVFFSFEFLWGTAGICHTILWGFSEAL